MICCIVFSRDMHSYIRLDLVDLFGFQIFRIRNLNHIQIFTNFGLDLVQIIEGLVRIRVRVRIRVCAYLTYITSRPYFKNTNKNG